MCIKSFPFSKAVLDFIEDRDQIFVIDQNRDGQMRKLLINELEQNPAKLVKVTHYDGMPITASFISGTILQNIDAAPTKKMRQKVNS